MQNPDPMQMIIDNLRAMQPEIQAMADSLKHYDDERREVYPHGWRGCSKNERVADLLAEARRHGCILAFKGEGESRVTAIVPFLVDGWIAHGGMQ